MEFASRPVPMQLAADTVQLRIGNQAALLTVILKSPTAISFVSEQHVTEEHRRHRCVID
ncbi:hypothetical protein ACQPWW_34220 [Micromonospora sp. CA-240977]|uniref:hypothetical protein n=1 Tax=Micromonospora sp. CA-240977 TaxID=3239957 RepID=UPI003D8FF266